MKKLSCYIGLLMATLWLSACKSDTPLEPDTTVGDGEQVLEITVDGDFYASSRSTAASAGYKLVSSQAIQHIEHLYAYIFKGSGTDATCVYVTEIPWEQNSQQGSASLTYRLKEANLPKYGKDDMQVLVVAVDNNTDTYNFPYGEVANHADDTNNQEGNNSIIGQQLSGVKLKLAEAAAGTTTSDADKAFKMANTEVFSGLASFKADDQIIKVSLQRCVAGVLCYLTDIPYYVGSGTEEANKISSIELQLGNNLNLNTEYASFYDGTRFGSVSSDNSESSDNKVIASVNISEYIYGKGTTNGTLYVQESDQSLTDENTQRLYVPAMDNGVVKTKENTILFGAYLLPIKNTANYDKTKATLKLVLKSNGGEQTAFIVKKTVTSVPGEPDASGSPTTITESAYAYSLKANRLYSIGSKPFATDTDADQPASLKGKEIELNVIDWTDGNINNGNDVNFPVYSLKSTISADWETQYENYIFNCMSETRTVYINLSEGDAKDKSFKISILGEDGSSLSNWAYFRFVEFDADGNSNALTDWKTSAIIPDELKGRSRIALEIRLNDYVLKNDIIGDDRQYPTIEAKIGALKKDFRTAYLHLLSQGTKSVANVSIRQFNAITAGERGFSRLDLGDQMGDNGVAKNIEIYYQYKFNAIGWFRIFGHEDSNDDGERDSNDAFYNHNSSLDDEYYGSALFYCRKEAYEWDGSSNKMQVRYWFLPAREELALFFDAVSKLSNEGDLVECINIRYDKWYLSSSTYKGRVQYVYGAKIKDKKCIMEEFKRTNNAFCRQARKFN